MSVFILGCLIWYAGSVAADAIPGCGGDSTAYLSDIRDPCVYFRCMWGEVHGPYACAQGTGVPIGYRGYRNPCMDNRKQCRGRVPKSKANLGGNLDYPALRSLPRLNRKPYRSPARTRKPPPKSQHSPHYRDDVGYDDYDVTHNHDHAGGFGRQGFPSTLDSGPDDSYYGHRLTGPDQPDYGGDAYDVNYRTSDYDQGPPFTNSDHDGHHGNAGISYTEDTGSLHIDEDPHDNGHFRDNGPNSNNFHSSHHIDQLRYGRYDSEKYIGNQAPRDFDYHGGGDVQYRAKHEHFEHRLRRQDNYPTQNHQHYPSHPDQEYDSYNQAGPSYDRPPHGREPYYPPQSQHPDTQDRFHPAPYQQVGYAGRRNGYGRDGNLLAPIPGYQSPFGPERPGGGELGNVPGLLPVGGQGPFQGIVPPFPGGGGGGGRGNRNGGQIALVSRPIPPLGSVGGAAATGLLSPEALPYGRVGIFPFVFPPVTAAPAPAAPAPAPAATVAPGTTPVEQGTTLPP